MEGGALTAPGPCTTRHAQRSSARSTTSIGHGAQRLHKASSSIAGCEECTCRGSLLSSSTVLVSRPR